MHMNRRLERRVWGFGCLLYGFGTSNIYHLHTQMLLLHSLLSPPLPPRWKSGTRSPNAQRLFISGIPNKPRGNPTGRSKAKVIPIASLRNAAWAAQILHMGPSLRYCIGMSPGSIKFDYANMVKRTVPARPGSLTRNSYFG